MRVGILGPLSITAEGRSVRLGGVRMRVLLSRLALDSGKPVAAATLIAAVWPDAPPDHPDAALQSLVSRLRRALPAEVVRSTSTGYLLDVPPDSVDADRFERLAGEGRRSMADRRFGAAAERLQEALSLWRGEAFADAADSPFATAAAARLEELRLQAVEDRIEVDLALGSEPPVAELEELLAAHPLRERARYLHMRVLDIAGRAAEALAAYDDYRRLLVEELGTDPGPRIRDLHIALLRGSEDQPHKGNLRAPSTSFVGREPERRRIGDLLTTHRLITLTGPGGVGKTRLATTIAADSSDRAWLVDLATVVEPSDVPAAAALAVGTSEERLADLLSIGESLLVLDNCEHVIDAAARLADDLLGRCPPLRILATSREALGITAETVHPVGPLPVDDAVRLFTDRAAAAQPGFVAGAELEEICRRLDGLPLAIELAAARLRTMPIDRMAARLDDRFRLLANGSRIALPRHRTLHAVVEWSWDLLDATERDAAERLAVFPAGFTPEAAEYVGVDVETLDTLIEKSVLTWTADRCRMLETIREYGLERLAATERLTAARAAHAAYYLQLAERAEPMLHGADQVPWLARLAADRDHLLAALGFANDRGDAETAVRLGAALAMFWTIRGEHAEAVRRLGDILTIAGDVPGTAWMAATVGYLFNAVFTGEQRTPPPGPGPDPNSPLGALILALSALQTGDIDAGLEALHPHVTHDDAWTRAMVWLVRSFLNGAELELAGSGELTAGLDDLNAAIDAFREAGERWGLALGLASRAFALTAKGDYDGAVTALSESVAVSRELGGNDQQRVWLAMVRLHAGELEQARAELWDVLATAPLAIGYVALADLARFDGDLTSAAESLEAARRHAHNDDLPFRALHDCAAGQLAVATGEHDAAASWLSSAFAVASGMPDPPMLAQVAVAAADLVDATGDVALAARLLGAAAALRGGSGTRHPDAVRLTHRLRDEPGFVSAYDRGLRAADPLELIKAVLSSS